MKIFRNLTDAIVKTLESIFNGNRYADRAIEFLFKSQPKWGARDRRFVAETIYDIVRQYRLLNELVTEKNNWYEITGTYLLLRGATLPDWEEFKSINAKNIREKINLLRKNRAVFQSIPDWLDETGSAELGGRWNRELEALNEQAPVVLRANTLKTSVKKLQEELLKENVDTIAYKEYPDALILKERKNIFTSLIFKQGMFEVQDASSQLVARFLKVEGGLTVVDACAGAGGKTLHMAAMMQNKGRIIAMDVEEYKLEELKKRAKRAGVNNIETRIIASEKDIDKLANTADRLLLDAPCSGLGVLKRNPDAKWKMNPARIDELKKVQQKILQDYSRMLKVKGLMVYATCSILPSENRKQVDTFLSANPDFTFVEDRNVYPSEGFDGFYMCLMRRTG